MALTIQNLDGPQRRQTATNRQPATRQANQLGQAPYFQAASPRQRQVREQVQPQVQDPQAAVPAVQPGKALMQPNYAPSAWGLQAPASAGAVAGMVQPAVQPQTMTMANATGTPQVGTAPYQSGLSTLASQLLQRLSETAAPNTGALKEKQKETLNQLRSDSLARERASAASRGVSLGGNLGGREAGINDAYAGALTGAYRDIEQEAEQQAFNNLLASSGLAGSLGGAEEQRRLAEELGRAGINLNVGAQNLDWSQLAQQGSQFNRQMSLQEALAAASMDQNFLSLLMQLLG